MVPNHFQRPAGRQPFERETMGAEGIRLALEHRHHCLGMGRNVAQLRRKTTYARLCLHLVNRG